MLDIEPRVFTLDGSRTVRQTSLGIFNVLLRLSGSFKRCFRTKVPPHPQISSLGFRMNIEWERMDTIPPTTLQEDISALLLIWDTVVSIQSLRSSAVNSTVWADFLLPLDFPCDLPQPLAQALLFPGMSLGCMAEWNMDTALSMLSLCLILSCYWLCASGLSKMHTRNLKNSHAVPYPSIRIYYMLTHKSHKGFKDTFS